MRHPHPFSSFLGARQQTGMHDRSENHCAVGGADIAFYVGATGRIHTRQCMRHPHPFSWFLGARQQTGMSDCPEIGHLPYGRPLGRPGRGKPRPYKGDFMVSECPSALQGAYIQGNVCATPIHFHGFWVPVGTTGRIHTGQCIRHPNPFSSFLGARRRYRAHTYKAMYAPPPSIFIVSGCPSALQGAYIQGNVCATPDCRQSLIFQAIRRK